MRIGKMIMRVTEGFLGVPVGVLWGNLGGCFGSSLDELCGCRWGASWGTPKGGPLSNLGGHVLGVDCVGFGEACGGLLGRAWEGW